MAKKTKIEIDVRADDKGSLKKVGVNSKQAGQGMHELSENTNNARRNMGGMAQMSNRGAKNFSKLQQGVGGLVGVYATLAAQVFAVSAAFQFLKSASDVVNLIAGQEALGAVTGVAYKTITASIKEATGGQIAYADAAKAAAIGTAAGLTPDQLNRLGAAAKNVSHALGRDLTDSFNRLVRGITKAEPELLDELGIILRLDDAAKNYADALGLDSDKLSVFQKSQAVANEVLTQAEEKFGAINEIMDPSAASLNKFLVSFDDLMNSIKTGAMKGLRPVFDFLAGNTKALSVALGLMALPLLKTVLPAFDKWEEESAAKFKKQSEALEKYKETVEETATAVKAMSGDSAAIGKSSGAVLGALGKSTTGKKGGGAGADFLLGTSDSKKSQRNARRILDKAKSDMKKHGQVMTGYLAGASKKQLKILERNYEARILMLKDMERQHGMSWARMTGHVRLWGQEAKLQMSKVKMGMTKFAGVVGKIMGKLFDIAMWAGFAAMVAEVFIKVLDNLHPISDESKKLKKRIESLTKSTTTFTEELQKTVEVQPFLTLEKQVIALGNSLTSGNIVKNLQELRELASAPTPADDFGDKWDDWITNNIKTADHNWVWLRTLRAGSDALFGLIASDSAKALDKYQDKQRKLRDAGPTDLIKENLVKELELYSQLEPEMEDYAKKLKERGYLNKNELAAIEALREKWSTAGQAMISLTQNIKDMNAAMQDLIGTGLVIDPTKEVRAKMELTLANMKTGLASMEAAQATNKGKLPGLQAKVDTAQATKDELTGRDMSGVKETAERTPQWYHLGRAAKEIEAEADRAQIQLDKWQTSVDNASKALEINIEKLQQVKDNIAAGEKELEKFEKEQVRIGALLEIFEARSEDITNNVKERLALEVDTAKMRTLGITVEGKRQNLLVDENNRMIQMKKLEEAKYNALTSQQAAQKDLDLAAEGEAGTKQIILDRAKQAVAQAEHNIELQKISNVLEQQKTDKLREQLDHYELMQPFLTETRKEGRRVKQRKIKRADDQHIDMYGRSKGGKAKNALDEETRALRKEDYRDQINLHTLKQSDMELELVQMRRQYASGEKNGMQTLAAIEAMETKIQKEDEAIDQLNQKIRLIDRFNQLQLKGMRDANAESRQKLGDLALNPLTQAQNQAESKLGPNASKRDKQEARDLAKDHFNLNLQLQETDQLYSTIQGSMTDAFADMITGAKSAKEAFASMAKSMLAELAKIIAKRLMLKALGALGFREGGITPVLSGPSFAVGGVARGPRAGYNATLHGNEAVVPLPSGGAIPVHGTGLGGGTNNVTVNVAIDNNGNASSNATGMGQGQEIGKVVAKAVQEELQYQKRSGGILNPYGAA